MSLKVKWLDGRQLKGLRIDLNFIGSTGLLETLDDYVGVDFESIPKKEYLKINVDGNYLCNVFSDEEIRELEYLNENYRIMALM